MRYTVHSTAAALADVCAAKNAAYGDSVGKSAEMLQLHYPAGIPPSQYLNALIAARIFDKQHRLAQGADAAGEDPRVDIGGYALLALHIEKEKKSLCPGGASAIPVPVGSPAKAQPGSAAPSASNRTTPNADATFVQPNSPSLSGCSESTWASASTPTDYAPAPIAKVPAAKDESVEDRRLSRIMANVALALTMFFGLRWFCYTPFLYRPITLWSLGPVVLFMVGGSILVGYIAPPERKDRTPVFFDSREDEW